MKLFEHNILHYIFSVTLCITVILSTAVYANPLPGDACTPNQRYTQSSGPDNAGNTNLMVCASGTWRAILSADSQGRLTKIGNLTCANDNLLMYNGSSWSCGTPTCTDAMPGSTETIFTPHVANATPSTLVTSDTIRINGITCLVNVMITGDPSAEYRICRNSNCAIVEQDWGNGFGTIPNDRFIQLRLTAPATPATLTSVNLYVGEGMGTWEVSTTTTDCSPPSIIGTVCPDGSVYAGITPDGFTPFYVTRCDAGQTWDGTQCTGTRTLISFNNGGTTYTETDIENLIAGQANTAALAALADAGAPYQAATYCDQLTAHGHSDWYLPAYHELKIIHQKNTAIGNFNLDDGYYWSSNESTRGPQYGWSLRFSDNFSQDREEKQVLHNIRCARK